MWGRGRGAIRGSTEALTLGDSWLRCLFSFVFFLTGMGESSVQEMRDGAFWFFCFVNNCFSFFFLNIYLAALGLSCSMWHLVPWPGIKSGSPALGIRSLSRWTTKEVPGRSVFNRLLEAPVTQGRRGHLRGPCRAQAGFCCVSKESTVLIAQDSGVCLLGLPQQSEFKWQNYGLTVLGVGRPRSRCQHNQQEGQFLLRLWKRLWPVACPLGLVVCWQPLSFIGLQIHHPVLCFILTWCCPCVCVYKFPLFTRTLGRWD